MSTLSGASQAETSVLRRNTSWPKQDFIIAPLAKSVPTKIFSPIGGKVPSKILHIQIQKAGFLEFGAYDNFQSISFGNGLSQDFIDLLITRELLSHNRQ